MKVRKDQWANAWEALIEDRYANEDRKIIAFVSTSEVDSVCATRVLQVSFSYTVSRSAGDSPAPLQVHSVLLLPVPEAHLLNRTAR